MKRFVIGFLAVLGVLALLAIVVVGMFGAIALLAKPGVPSRTVLQVDFEQGVIESVPDDAVARVMLADRLQVLDVVDALDAAAGDDRVEALVARIGGGGIGLAHIQEIRDAVLRFRESGKRAVAFAETFGEFGPGTGGYYLATAFDEIYMQPSGDVGLVGMMYETPFLRDALAKIGVRAQMQQRYQFKNAMNTFTETGFTDAHRTAMDALMQSQFDQIVRGVAGARDMDEAAVRKLVDRGPFLGREALDAGLVDGLMYEHEVYAKLNEDLGHDLKPLYLSAYLDRNGRPNTSGETVALIEAAGTVSRGEGGYSPLDGSIVMGSDAVVRAVREALDDDRVKAIILRVDSPGGSYVASDTIWRETVRAQEEGKPVIVSMGNLAASGGYFVSMHADRIISQPGTITGSIGVFGGKFVTQDMWRKLGVHWDDVHTGANADMFTGVHPYDEREQARLGDWLDRVYRDFTGKVADGRKIDLDQVLEIAKGRIWTGEDALELGLVDALGGWHEALAAAREVLDLPPDAKLHVRRIPGERTPFELLLEQRPDHRRAARAALAEVLRTVQPGARALAAAWGDTPPGVRVPGDLEPAP